MLKFIRVHGTNIDLDIIKTFTDDQLDDAYFDLKSEMINVQTRLGDLRIDEDFDKVREAGLKSAARHIQFGIEFVAYLRKDRRVKLADRFMSEARKSLEAEDFDEILDAIRE